MKYRSAIVFFIALAFTGIDLQVFVRPAASLEAEYRIGAITANVNLRQTPSLQGKIVTGLLEGLPVKIYGEKDSWYQVSAMKNHMLFNGWIYTRYVEIVSTETGLALPKVKKPEPLPPAPPEKPLPAPVQTSLEPEKTDVTMAPELEIAVEKSSRPADQKEMQAPSTENSTAPAIETKSADPFRLLLFISPLVLAIIVLLIAARVFKAARTATPAAEPVERLPVDRPPETQAKPSGHERRQSPRLNRLIEVDFAVGGKFFRGFISNLSETGVYIDTSESFTVGQEIIISCPNIDTGGYAKRAGQIVRLGETGIGVKFQPNEMS